MRVPLQKGGGDVLAEYGRPTLRAALLSGVEPVAIYERSLNERIEPAPKLAFARSIEVLEAREKVATRGLHQVRVGLSSFDLGGCTKTYQRLDARVVQLQQRGAGILLAIASCGDQGGEVHLGGSGRLDGRSYPMRRHGWNGVQDPMIHSDSEQDHRGAEEPDPVERLVVECIDRVETDGWSAIEEVCDRAGSKAPEVRRRLEMLERMGMLEPSPSDTTPPNERLGEFRLLREIGRGGMGVVFLAEQEPLGRLVALKVLRPGIFVSETARQRFEREGQLLSRVRDPHIVRVIAAGEEHGVGYLAMEFVPGTGLDRLIAKDMDDPERPSVARIATWTRDVAKALHGVHTQGILHRDIKPSNIWITEDGQAMLLDFGLARDVDAATLTATGEFQGTPFYAAPEAVNADRSAIGPGIDVYGLGAVLYESLSGKVPFGGRTTAQVLRAILVEDPPRVDRVRRGVSRDLATVVEKAMQREPEARYASTAELADDLDAVLTLRPVSVRAAGPVKRTWKWCRRRPALATVGAVALLALMALPTLVMFQSWSRERDRREAAVGFLVEARELLSVVREELLTRGRDEAEYLDLSSHAARHRLSDDERGRLDALERRLAETSTNRDRFRREIESLVQRASMYDDLAAKGRRVLSSLYLELGLSRDVVQSNDDEKTRTQRKERRRLLQLAATLDPSNPALRKVDATVRREFNTDPPGAEVHLFRLEEQIELFADGEPRIVPVPWRAEADDLPVRPGTWALRVVDGNDAVQDHDEIIRLRNVPVRGTVLVRQGHGEVREFDRLIRIGDRPIESVWQAEYHGRPGALRGFLFARSDQVITVQAKSLGELGVEVESPQAAAKRGGMQATLVRNGQLIDVQLPAGLELRTSATPLQASPDSLVGTTPCVMDEAPQGSYLVVFRLPGHRELRTYIHHVDGTFRLTPKGTLPTNFVPIIARNGENAWIQDHEVTCAQYLEFLNDPKTGKDRLPQGEEMQRRGMWSRADDGRVSLAPGFENHPVMGVTWFDAVAYAKWFTGVQRAAGSQLEFSLCDKWLSDRARESFRFFVFGDTYRQQWIKGCFSRLEPWPEPILSYPVDESLLGVFDLSGSAAEWHGEDHWFSKERVERGVFWGSWGQADPKEFGKGYVGRAPDTRSETVGFRLMAEPAK